MSTAEQISFWLSVAMLPWSALFIWRFSRDYWWRTWFGRSLMAIAVALVLGSVSTMLFRLYGRGYWGRDVVIVATPALALFAIVSRTVVLIHAQNAEKRSRALTEHRH